MLYSSVPTKIPLPWATSGSKTSTIPETAAGISTPGQASFDVGFPALTATPLAGGGAPPTQADFNAILFYLCSIARWANAGGTYKYDSTFSSDTNVSGYPAGSVLLNTAATGLWLNTADGNTSNPDTGGAGWLALVPRGEYRQTTGLANFTVPSGITTIYITAVAGGGGGGGAGGNLGNTTSTIGIGSGGGGGGGAGGYLVRQAFTVTPGQVIPITVGAGGAGGAAATSAGSAGISGNAGTNTIIGSLTTLIAGSGGSGGGGNSSSVPGAGGSGGAGYPSGGAGTDGAFAGNGGMGAASALGGGGGGGRAQLGASGVAASPGQLGGGGGGAGGVYGPASLTGLAGAAGGAGFVIIEW